MDSAASTLFFHPLKSPLPEPMHAGTPLAWTPDIDGMLLLITRQHAFDFAVVATHVQRYIRNVHAAGGMLPERVTAAVQAYDACACRLRWAQLDHEACGLMREAMRRHAAGLAPFEDTPPPASRTAVAPTISVSAPVKTGGAEGDSDGESEEEDTSGIVDVNALRRRLMADAGFTVSAAEEPPHAPGPAPIQHAQAPLKATSALARQPAAAVPAAAAVAWQRRRAALLRLRSSLR